MKVKNMTSLKSDRQVANQFIINGEAGIYFQSYKAIIAFKPYDKMKTFYNKYKGKSLIEKGLIFYPEIYLDADTWDYSVTTGKYRNQFLRENKKATERKIKDGTYILTNLN